MRRAGLSLALVIMLMLGLPTLSFDIAVFAVGEDTGYKETTNENAASEQDITEGDSATEEQAAGNEDEKTEDGENETEEEPKPHIHTVLSAWDILNGREDSIVSGSEENPAQIIKYTEYRVDEEKEKEIEEQEKEAEKKAEKLAEKEAQALAEELIANGIYKDLMGEENRYEKYWADEYDSDEDYEDDGADLSEDDDNEYDDTEDTYIDSDEDEDIEDYDEEEDNIHSGGEYYSSLQERYPHILEFWFEEDGHYIYDYDVDYDSIDYDSMFYEVSHDIFHVIDRVEYTNFEPGAQYSLTAQLVRLERDSSNALVKKDIIKEVIAEFSASDKGSGDIEIDFGELSPDYGRYVITLQIMDGNKELYAEHNDITNNYESMESEQFFLEHANNGANPGNLRVREKGQIKFPKDSSEVKRAKTTPNTGDESSARSMLYLGLFFASALAMIALKIFRKGDPRTIIFMKKK